MEYNEAHIESLLERYFEGDTDLRQEAELREFFRSADPAKLPQRWACARTLFAYLDDRRAECAPRGIGLRIPRRESLLRRVARYSAAAAAAAVLAAGLLTLSRRNSEPVYCYIDGQPVTDLETAFRATGYLQPLNAFGQSVGPLDELFGGEGNETDDRD